MFELKRYRELLKDEVIQRGEEGCEVAGMKERAESVADETAAEGLYAELQALKPGSKYSEPSTLSAIMAERPDGPRRIALKMGDDELKDRILGGWLGRCAGCQLGKPVEGWHHDAIRDYLEGAGENGLTGYFPSKSKKADGSAWEIGWGPTRDRIKCAERDDDQDYTVFGMSILERRGPDFKTDDVGADWLNYLPYYQVYTAEREAYRNLVEGYWYPQSATRWNPYREWIGAQIRADGFGYCAPGWLEKAAEFGFRDAALSHVKNGIYGEMFMAAAISAAFVTGDMKECLRLASSAVPRNTRFSEMVADCVKWAGEAPDFEAAWQKVNAKYGHYHGVHTINNAAVCIIALLMAGGDFEKTITWSVLGGWDTDCNGATVGSIIGAMLGAKRLPEKWVAPLNDTLRSALFGFSEIRISELAGRTYNTARKVLG